VLPKKLLCEVPTILPKLAPPVRLKLFVLIPEPEGGIVKILVALVSTSV
jgi:hypothetical protein